jgi:NADH:ubiquinone oxidoreductase subunit 5 (subunit L)/multisubunit Na+/H+ antiporter MnhA subunit
MITDRLLSGLVLLQVAAPAAMLAAVGLPAVLGITVRERGITRIVGAGFTIALAAALAALGILAARGFTPHNVHMGTWFHVGHQEATVDLVADALSIPFVCFSTGLCGLVNAFAGKYLHREPGFTRFFILLALFGTGMNLLVLAGSIDVLFAGWECVGISSTLLIGFFHDRVAAAAAAVRAFVTYRICDAGLLAAGVVLHAATGSGDFERAISGGWPGGTCLLSPGTALVVALLLIFAALGKSGQVPFSAWLPRAMEGPTPSSAIFYGALSIHAGAYLLLRCEAILEAAPKLALDGEAVPRLLAGGAATLALLATAHPVLLVLLWVATTVPTFLSLRASPGGLPAARVYGRTMAVAVACLAAGCLFLVRDPPWRPGHGITGDIGGWLVAVAVMLRKGVFPLHSWYPAIYASGAYGTALAATMAHTAGATAIRLLVGHADGVAAELVFLAQAALVTTVYGAALAVVQRDLRGLVGTLAMSQSALVLAGLAGSLPTELCGALAVWISAGLSLTGIGLVAWAIESRAGSVPLDAPQGRADDAPALAMFFLLFGLATLGLPGTLSFIADDLIVSGALDEQLHAGLLVILSTVFAGIALVRGWFTVFGGPAPVDRPRHPILPRERVVFTALLALLVGLGLWPGPLVTSLERIAGSLLASRHEAPSSSLPTDPSGGHPP